MSILDPMPPPAPRRSDVLFRADNDHWSANACMSNRSESDLPYLWGYRSGARLLAEHVCERATEQDLLVYPIVYLYRHHVELALKRLLILAANLAQEELDRKCLNDLSGHHIGQLWSDCKRILTAPEIQNSCGFTLPIEDTEGIDSYIRQLSTVDPDAQAFRYARDKKGRASLPDSLTHINIAVFADHMERLCSHLDGIDSYLDHMREIRDEMEAEARSEYMDYYNPY